MTFDEFSSRYRLLKATGRLRTGTSTAEHRASGRVVLVHFFEGGLDGPGTELLGLIERLAPADRTRVLETLTVDDSIVFVTQFLPGGQEFEPWLRSAAGAPPPGPGPGTDRPPDAGEFTALFRPGEASPEPARPAPPQRPGPGSPSFTELFRPPPAQPTPSDPIPAAGPGPVEATPPPVRVVGVRLPTPPAQAKENRAPPIPIPHLGGAHARPPAAPPSPEPPVPRPAALYVPESAVPPPPQPAPWSGPSDFTRQLNPGVQFSDQVPVVPAPATPPEAPVRKTSYLPLFIALNLIFIIATGLVVYFALRNC